MVEQEQVAIFWDFENCSPSSSGPGYDITNNIREIAHRFGIVKVFKAYLDSAQSSRSSSLRSELQSCGVSLTDCPHNGRKDVADKMMLVDMLTYAIDTPSPATLVLITGDRDFVYAVSVLRLRKYRIVVVAPNSTHISLRMQASEVLDWNTDVLGKPTSEDPSTLNSPGLATLASAPTHRRTQSTSNVADPTNALGLRAPRRSFGKTMGGLNADFIHSAPQSAPRTPMGQSKDLRSPLPIVKQMEEPNESALEVDESPILDLNEHIQKLDLSSQPTPARGRAASTASQPKAASGEVLEPLPLGSTIVPAFESSTSSESTTPALTHLNGGANTTKDMPPHITLSVTSRVASQFEIGRSSDAISPAGSAASLQPPWKITSSRPSAVTENQGVDYMQAYRTEGFASGCGSLPNADSEASTGPVSLASTTTVVSASKFEDPPALTSGSAHNSKSSPTNVVSTPATAPLSPAQVSALFRSPHSVVTTPHSTFPANAPTTSGEAPLSPAITQPPLSCVVTANVSSTSFTSQLAAISKTPTVSPLSPAQNQLSMSSPVTTNAIVALIRSIPGNKANTSPSPVLPSQSRSPVRPLLVSSTSAPPVLTPASGLPPSDVSQSTKPIPKGYGALLVVLERCRMNGQLHPTRHHVAEALKKVDPEAIKLAGHKKFRPYTNFAAAYGMIELGGDQDKAWMALSQEWHGRAEGV